MYDPVLVQPMREEVTEVGFKELLTTAEVDSEFANQKGTALLFVNSVCGCAAGGARPGIRIALQRAGAHAPAKLLTVFAGMEREATNKARGYIVGYAPSSPMIALFKDGEPVHVLERHHIEGQMPDTIARNLVAAFEEFC